MRRYENQCCGCAVPAYPCIGNACKYRHVLVVYCDKCGDPIDGDTYYDVDGEELCDYCLKEKFKKEITP